jgi:nucleoside-diphosphate-sugar epimerase
VIKEEIMPVKKILLTGGSGFIGQHLTNFFKKRNDEIAWVSRKKPLVKGVKWINIDSNLKKEVLNFKPDFTIHLAACFNNSDIQALIDCNTILPIKLLEILKLLPINKRNFIYTGSYWQNGDYKKPHIPIDLYSASKKSLRPYVSYYHAYHDVSAIELINFGTYGAKDGRGKLLDQLIQIAKTGKSLKLSPGRQSLNLVHINDVCNAYLVACKLMCKNDTRLNHHYSIASDKEIRVNDMVAVVEKISGKKLSVSLGGIPYRDVEVFKPVYNEPILPEWSEIYMMEEYIADFFRVKNNDKF